MRSEADISGLQRMAVALGAKGRAIRASPPSPWRR